MREITIIEGRDLQYLLDRLTDGRDSIRYIRISPQEGGGVKVKINEGMWSYTHGQADRPRGECENKAEFMVKDYGRSALVCSEHLAETVARWGGCSVHALDKEA